MKSLRRYRLYPILASICTLSYFISPVLAFTALANSSERVIFATRNIYLGADVGIAMKKLPNFPAAAQFMWDQVSANDFAMRAPLLAQELLATGAAVIGIQEATTWKCRSGFFSDEVVVYDYLTELIDALNANGANYSIAHIANRYALNPGFEISPIPHLTLVNDKKIFPSLFGKERVACGFTISDALLVRGDIEVLDAGISEYSATYSIIPTLMTIYRGYAWADLRSGESTFRAITTHLESLWERDVIPNAALQADQLIADLATAKMPVVVMGDFNSDPRDPRPSDEIEVNPGAQPSASAICQGQVMPPSLETAREKCSAYWKFLRAGFTEVSPNAFAPQNFSWGADALLAGPAPERIKASIAMGGNGIFTDRLDYIFIKNSESAINGAIFGNQWPEGLNTWRCTTSEQISMSSTSVAAIEKLKVERGRGKGASGSLNRGLPNEGRCLPSDHAGIAGAADLALGVGLDPRLPTRARSPITLWRVIGGGAFLAGGGLLLWRVRRRVDKG